MKDNDARWKTERQMDGCEVICAEVCGALLSREWKGIPSTIDGKLIAVRVASPSDPKEEDRI